MHSLHEEPSAAAEERAAYVPADDDSPSRFAGAAVALSSDQSMMIK
ncbi:hypothetical protein [Natronomonas salsuginis]|jgi:hypothetical protein|nr:hypothetical protein [Natronomonas salsuginis]